MNKRLIVIASSIAALALVSALTYRAMNRSDTPVVETAAQMSEMPRMVSPEPVREPSSMPSATEEQRAATEAAAAAAEAARAEQEELAEAVADAQDAAAEEAAAGPTMERAAAEAAPSPFEGLALFDEEVVAALVEEYGSIKAVYDLANAEERMDLIGMLAGEEMLRDEIASLLLAETDPELRRQMIDSVDPRGFFDPDFDDDYVDSELLDLLSRPTSTPMTEEEWMARMDLAHLILQEEGLTWAQQARTAFPDSPAVQLLADSITLHTAASLGQGSVPGNQANQAMESLYSALGNQTSMATYSADERIRAYYTLYPFDNSPVDPHRTLEFYRTQMQTETDPRALDLLINLDQRIVQRHGDLVASNPQGNEETSQ